MWTGMLESHRQQCEQFQHWCIMLHLPISSTGHCFVLFFTWSGSFSNPFLSFQGIRAGEQQGQGQGGFQACWRFMKPSRRWTSRSKAGKIQATKLHCFHDLVQKVIMYLKDTVCYGETETRKQTLYSLQILPRADWLPRLLQPWLIDPSPGRQKSAPLC